MQNKLAIAATIAALILTVLALGATLVSVWPDEPRPVATGVEAFEPAQIGQAKPNDDFVGPEMPPEKELVKAPTPEKTPLQREVPPRSRTKQRKYKPAVLQVVTNFERADVKVNGLPYPEYYEPGEPEGMVLPAGGPYNVEVTFGTNVKVYNLHLRPHETRLLIVELSGYNSGAPAAPPKKKVEPPAKKEEPAAKPAKEEKSDTGKITVYSKPAGSVIVDGKATEEKTPGTVDLENGRHEVQVKYETGSVSEKKIVRVRNGSRIKLFFRERQK